MQAGQMPNVINLSGSLMVERAMSMKDELVAAFAAGDKVILDVSAIDDIDLSCLQVIYAAGASAKAAGKELNFTGSLSSHIAERLLSCGFLNGPIERFGDLESALVGF